MMMSDLPKDLVEEILCRVPATSRKRIQSTCKQWNRLFNNRRFTRKHFEKATKQFLVLMLREYRVCSISVISHEVPSVNVTGELALIDHHYSCFKIFEISQVFHCDGLLLCMNGDYTRMVVWNPCTGQTRRIQARNRDSISGYYAFGSYQDSKTGNISYKILCYWVYGDNNKEIDIYDLNSDSWRTSGVTMDSIITYIDWGMSLKGKTYWFGLDEEKEKQLHILLVTFDYTTERFKRLPLPCQCTRYETVSLSTVREEKLAVLLQHVNTSRTEVWVTNKICETKVVSWSKVLTVDLRPELDIWHGVSFLVDEGKKVLVCCDKYFLDGDTNTKTMVYVVGEDNNVTHVNMGFESNWPFLFNYVPSLTQIHQDIGGKRKRGQ